MIKSQDLNYFHTQDDNLQKHSFEFTAHEQKNKFKGPGTSTFKDNSLHLNDKQIHAIRDEAQEKIQVITMQKKIREELEKEIEKLKDELEKTEKENNRLVLECAEEPTIGKDSFWSEGWNKMENTYNSSLKDKQRELKFLDQEYEGIQGEVGLIKAELDQISNQKVYLKEVASVLESEVNYE